MNPTFLMKLNIHKYEYTVMSTIDLKFDIIK